MSLDCLEMRALKSKLLEHLKSGDTRESLEAARDLIDIAALGRNYPSGDK